MLQCAIILWSCYLVASDFVGSIKFAALLLVASAALTVFGVLWLSSATRFIGMLCAAGCATVGVLMGLVTTATAIKSLVLN